MATMVASVDKVQIGDATLYHADCADVLPMLSKHDLVLTDPPYGIGAACKNGSSNLAETKYYGNDSWDDAPIAEDLMEMIIGTATKSIVFGGNYYRFPPSSCWLVWDKMNGDNDFADCELAWTNLDKAVRRIRFMWHGMLRDGKELRGDHPTQKPIAVMEWCLSHYKPALTVLDPFMGSGTTGVACAKHSLVFTGIERERKYFDIACERIDNAYRQQKLF